MCVCVCACVCVCLCVHTKNKLLVAVCKRVCVSMYPEEEGECKHKAMSGVTMVLQ
jgi:hypothetical protein